MASPITEPLPGSTLTMPLGTPGLFADARQLRAPSAACTSAGFTTTALPAASAGASFCASLAIGEFHGVIAATTPIGSCTLIVTKWPREGVIVSSSVSSAAAKYWKVPAALATRLRVSLIGLPLSRRCFWASVSLCSRISCATRCSTPARWCGSICAQPLVRKAWWARSMASSTSARLAALRRAIGSPVAG